MSKIVLTADFHVHPFRIASKDGGNDRLQDGLSCLRQSLELARREKAVWVFAGDFKLPKTTWPTPALTGSLSVFQEYADVEKVMLPGNHDERCEFGTGLAPFTSVARVVEKTDVIITGAGEFVVVPWGGDLEVARKALKKERRPLLSHGFLLGSFIGPEAIRLAGKGHRIEEFGDFTVAFFGDVHKGQVRLLGNPAMGRAPAWVPFEKAGKIREAGSWRGEVYYPGSPYQQNWGERNDPPKGALLVDMQLGWVKLVEFKAPKFRHLEPVDGAVLDLTKYEGDFVRLIMSEEGKRSLELSMDTDRYRSFDVIARRNIASISRAPEINASMGPGELVDAYIQAHPPAEQLDTVKVREAGVRLLTEP